MSIETSNLNVRPAHILPQGVSVEVACPAGEPIARELLSQLEELDDVIFTALEGSADALNEAADTWRAIRERVPDRLLEESREQYLRQAEAVWRRSQTEPFESLASSFAALEILTLLAE